MCRNTVEIISWTACSSGCRVVRRRAEYLERVAVQRPAALPVSGYARSRVTGRDRRIDVMITFVCEATIVYLALPIVITEPCHSSSNRVHSNGWILTEDLKTNEYMYESGMRGRANERQWLPSRYTHARSALAE